MVEAPFVRAQNPTGVLATITVALADRLGAQLRALLGHAREVHRDDNSRDADRTAHGLDRGVLRADRKGDPLLPPGGNWLPGLESHQHSRLQRALSYGLDDPAMVLAAGFAPALATLSTACL